MPKQGLLPLVQHLQEHETAFPVSKSLTTSQILKKGKPDKKKEKSR